MEESGLFRDAAVKGGSPSAGSVSGQLIQEQILQQLQKVNQRLDKVQHRMAEEEDTRGRSRGKLSTDNFSQAVKSKSTSTKQVSSDSSSDESEAPSLQYLKSKTLQQKVDRRIRDLDEATSSQDKEVKIKSKRGGNIEVHVKKKCPGPMRPYWVVSVGKGSVMINFRSHSGSRAFVEISWRKIHRKRKIL